MRKIMKKVLLALSTSLLLAAAAGTAHAVVTAGGATVHNAATLTFAGGTITAFVDVGVKTIASAPIITVDTSAQTVDVGQNATYVYTVTNTANGADTLSFAASSADVGVTGVAGLNVNGTGTNATSLNLGGSITSQANSVANSIVIPAGSEVNFAAGDTINIGNNVYTINAVTPGAIAKTVGTITTPETPTTITVTPVGASPAIAAGGISAGTQVGEVQNFSVIVTASTPTVKGTSGTHTVNLTGNTTEVTAGVGGTTVAYNTSAASLNETVTTVNSPNVALVKKVRNVTQGVATFATTGVTAQSGDTLEYQLTATEATTLSNATGSVLKDEVPVFTTYVPRSTKLNGNGVVDGLGNSLPLTNANGGLTVNSPAQAAGVIAAGASAIILFQVTVD